MDITLDLFEQLEELYQVKARHLKYLSSLLPDSWQTTIPRGYGDIWEQRDWKFFLKDYRPFPKPLKLLIPEKRQLVYWTLIGFANELVAQVNPESLAEFLDKHVNNPPARKNLEELFLGQNRDGLGFKAYGSMTVCAQEENRMIDRYLSMLRMFAEHDPRHFGVDEELRSLSIGFFREIDDFIRYLDSDIFLFKRFNKDMKELFRGDLSVGVLGAGMVGSVLELSRDDEGRVDSGSELTYTKIPPFTDMESVELYRELFQRYHGLLKDAGLNPPVHGIRYVSRGGDTSTVFITQRNITRQSIGTQVVSRISDDDCFVLFEMILDRIRIIADFNNKNTETKIGIDPRLSNWGVEGYDTGHPAIRGFEELTYLNTSTPMIKENGKDLLDPELVIMNLPGVSKPFIRTLMLDRYWKRFYSPREMVLDVITDFRAWGHPETTEKMIEMANEFLEEMEINSDGNKITGGSVSKRTRGNRFYQKAFIVFRKIERFFKVNLLRRKYGYSISEGNDKISMG